MNLIERLLHPREAFTWSVLYCDGAYVTEREARGWNAIRAGEVTVLRLTDRRKVDFNFHIHPGFEAVFTRRRRAVFSMSTGAQKSVTTITIAGERRPDGSDGRFTFLWPDGRVETSTDFEAYQE